MEAIKNYLDTMFAQLPNTQSVLNAKDELWQMMEDKYMELLAEGKSENEAVGTVISEFGNLSELAEALGLEQEVNQQMEEEVNVPSRKLTVDDAQSYVKKATAEGFKLALGVAILIYSFVVPIVLDVILPPNLDALAGIFFLCTIAVGIAVIVFSRLNMKEWEFLRREKCVLSMDATKYVSDEMDNYQKTYRTQVTAGVLCCSLFFIPCIVFDELIPVKAISDLAGACFFVCVGTGVLLLISAAQARDSYRRLLKLNGTTSVKANYKPEKVKEFEFVSPAAEAVFSVYWPTIVCVYLMTSFFFEAWLITWIIWPVAGIAHWALKKVWVRPKEIEE